MPATLLLADDSVTIQRVIELTFAYEDVRVVAVGDGDHAIQWIDTDPPDIVLADVSMPGVSGYDVSAHVKQSPALRHIPVLLLAGAFEPVDEQQAQSSGSDGVLVKPFEPQQLVSRVKELLAARPAATPWPADLPVEAPPEPAATPQIDAGAMELEELDRVLQMSEAELPVAEGRDRDYTATLSLEGFGAVPAPALDFAMSEWESAMPELAAAQSGDRIEVMFEEAEGGMAAGSGLAGASDLDAGPELLGPPEPLEPPAPLWESGSGVVTAMPDDGAMVAAPRAQQVPGLTTRVSLSNAFSALLAAEQAQPSLQVANSATTAISEQAVEDVIRRVLSRMTDEIVRKVVIDTAERLVREEIEKIKNNPD